MLQEYDFGDLYVRHAVDDCPEDRFFAMHVHERYEIYYFVSGSAEYLVEGSRYPLEPGSLLVMRPVESHRVKILGSKPYERFALNFFPAVLDGIDPQQRLMKPFEDRPLGRGNLYAPAEFGDVDLERIFMQMCEPGEEDYGKRLKLLTGLIRLLDMLHEAYTQRGSAEYMPPQSLSEQMVSYVNMHLFDKLSVPDLAEQFFLSTSQFSRVFKQATGVAPWEYITIKRLTAAKEKIRRGIPANAASESCGFGDYSAFYRAYTKYFGCTPKVDSL